MKRGKWLLMGLVFAGVTLAQEKPVEAPTVPDAVKVKILKAKLAQQRAETQFSQLQAQLQGLKGTYEKATQDLRDAEAEAYKEAKADKKDWVLDETGDDVRLAPVPKPKPAEPAKKVEPMELKKP